MFVHLDRPSEQQGKNMNLLEFLGVSNVIFLAPMGGGAGTPELAAAVSIAGGLGSLGGAYLTPEQLGDAIRRARSLTERPFGVNLFAGGYETDERRNPQPMLSALAGIHESLGIPPPVLPNTQTNPFDEQLEVVLKERPAVFSFTFGIPEERAMTRIKERGIRTFGTATTADEAVMLERSGVDAIVAQGAEAGAHRGTFAHPFEQAMVPTLDLVAAIHRKVSVPVIASGGLMDGRDISRSLKCGASAAQLGTAFLPCPESNASAAWKRAILEASSDSTVITRAFSGRPARGLANRFTTMFAEREKDILPFPLQNSLTRPMRGAAARLDRPEFLSLWAGQGVARARSMPAMQLVQTLLDEIERA